MMKKKISNKIYLAIILSLVVTSGFCQINFKNKVAKNILAYHIKYGIDTELGLYDGKLKTPKYIYRLIPLHDYELELYVSIDTSMHYPNENYKLYKIENPGFTFKELSGKVVKQNNFHTFMADRYYLVAYNEKDDDLKFISGNMFLSPIKDDFNIDINDSSSFNGYLLFRYYNYKLKRLTFIRKKKDSMIFTAYSDQINEEIKIVVNTKEVEDVKLFLLKSKEVY